MKKIAKYKVSPIFVDLVIEEIKRRKQKAEFKELKNMKKIYGRIFAVEVKDDRDGFKISIEVEITQEQWDEIFKKNFGESIKLEVVE